MPRPNKRILSLDDDDDNNQLMRLILEPEGYEVVAATTIADAFRLFVGGDFDLLNGWAKLPKAVNKLIG